MEFKGTKGPWKVPPYRIFQNVYADPEYPIHAPKRGLIAKAFREKDAKLMAAAPDLLEAVDQMLDDIGRDNSMPSAIKARAAIRKATE